MSNTGDKLFGDDALGEQERDGMGADGPIDLTSLERELCRLPEVTSVRIVDDHGRPTEVHVIARTGKSAKQIVRDVQSVSIATFGLEINRRIVSVVQLEEGDPIHEVAEAPPDFRPVIVGINAEASGLRTLVRVTLAADGREAVGFAEGTIASTARHRLVASATVDALRQLTPAAECLDVESAQVTRAGIHDVAVVTIVAVVPPEEQVISGSAVVRLHQDAEAVARAVLDATNRRLPRLSL